MMKLSKALMLSVSGLIFTSNGSAASIHNLTSFNSPGAVTFVHTPYTHTSHPEEMLLSSSEDFNFVTLTRSLRSDLSPQGRGKIRALSSSGLTRGSRWSEEANPLRGRRKENNPVNCFLTTGAELLICDPAAATEANVTVAADRSKLVLPFQQHLRSQTGQGEGDKIKLAATCFVTDTSACSGNEFSGNNADDDGHGAPGGPGDGDDYDLDNAERCRQEGYTQTSCPEGQEPSNTCPYDSSYFEKCVSSCPSNYVTCEKPYYGVGEACDGKYASCECTPCGSGYDNTTIPEGYVQDGEACLDCDGKTKYKIKPNPCDGYMDCGSMGGEAGAKTCLSGTTTMYDNCKACPNLGEYTTCPSCTICQYEECSGLWYATGCATNCTDYCDFCGG